MTRREKYLTIGGAVVGLLLAGLLVGASRLIWPRPTVAKMEAPGPADESMPMEASDPHANHRGAVMPGETRAPAIEPQASLQLSDEEQRSIGIQTVAVQRKSLKQELVAPAQVEQPETQLTTISARVGGRVDELHVDFTGQPVRRGQPIAEIYSPEVLTAAEEYKLALDTQKRLGQGAEIQAVEQAKDLVSASRRRLDLWGLTLRQIDSIATSDKPQIDLTIYSPASGIVSERKVTQGQYVSAGEALYTLTDLSTVWIKADVYEGDLPKIRVGQSVQLTSDSLPNQTLHGKVNFLEPMVNAQTRTTTARIQVPNPAMRLRPGMFVQARFVLPSATPALVVPRSAVVNTGERKLVYVAKGGGLFEARPVELGAIAEENYPVTSGLKAGERVVTEGNFLVDSQTRITSGMSGMFGGSKEFEQSPQTAAPAATYKISFRSDPATPRGESEAKVFVTLLDETGKAVSDAQIRVTLFMPAMPEMGMAELRQTASLTWQGNEYAGTIKVPGSGTFSVTVQAKRGDQALATYRTSLNAR